MSVNSDLKEPLISEVYVLTALSGTVHPSTQRSPIATSFFHCDAAVLFFNGLPSLGDLFPLIVLNWRLVEGTMATLLRLDAFLATALNCSRATQFKRAGGLCHSRKIKHPHCFFQLILITHPSKLGLRTKTVPRGAQRSLIVSTRSNHFCVEFNYADCYNGTDHLTIQLEFRSLIFWMVSRMHHVFYRQYPRVLFSRVW